MSKTRPKVQEGKKQDPKAQTAARLKDGKQADLREAQNKFPLRGSNKFPLRGSKKFPRRGIRKWLPALLMLVLLVAAAGYTVFIAPLFEQDKWVYKETTVERGPLTVGVTESGSLEYGITTIEYDLDLEVGDDEDDEDGDDEESEEAVQKYLKVENVYTAAGQRIAEGDPLIKFTEDSVSDVRKLLQKALVDAQAAYQEAEGEYDLAVLEAGTDYQSSEVGAKYASSLYQSSGQSVDNDISAMEVEIEQRKANVSSLEEKQTQAYEDYEDAYAVYEDAKAVMDQTGTEHASNFLTIQSEYLSARNKYESALSALEQAEEKLRENAEQIEKLQTQVTRAAARRTIDKLDVQQNYQESLIVGDNAQITYQAKLESLKEELNEALEEKTTIEEQLTAFDAFVGEDGILYANGSGIVTQVGYAAGDTLKEAGTAVSFAGPEDMTISVDVTQEDVTTLSVGDKVEILFGAYEEEPYEGTILSIDTTATSRDSATISYQVVIGVEGDTQKLYGGMTADVTFVTQEREDVLYLSKKAVVEEKGKTFVYVDASLGGKELREVTTGLSNSNYVEILSGLGEGDSVYIASKVSSQSEVENSSAEGGTGNNGEAEGMPGNSLPGGFEAPEDGFTITMPDGAMQQGTMPDGVMQQGTMPDGVMQQGTMPDGAMSESFTAPDQRPGRSGAGNQAGTEARP